MLGKALGEALADMRAGFQLVCAQLLIPPDLPFEAMLDRMKLFATKELGISETEFMEMTPSEVAARVGPIILQGMS